MAEVVVAARRGVAPHDVLAANISLYRNVLSNRETENVILLGQTEAIAGRAQVKSETLRTK